MKKSKVKDMVNNNPMVASVLAMYKGKMNVKFLIRSMYLLYRENNDLKGYLKKINETNCITFFNTNHEMKCPKCGGTALFKPNPKKDKYKCLDCGHIIKYL